MSLRSPGMRSQNDYFLTTTIEDVSTPDTAYIVVPDDGYIVKWISTLENAITGANSIVKLRLNGVFVTGTSHSVGFFQSAAGDVDFSHSAAASNHRALEGDVIGIETDGGSSGVAKLFCTVVIRRGAR